jgi:glycerol uptake facilitator protein
LNNLNSFAGELIGTFILTFFGCGAVATSVLYSANMGSFQVAGIWGIGVTVAIYATRHLSCAHLNPAVSLAMVIGGRMKAWKLPIYLAAQFMGALSAGLVLLGVFSKSIANFEAAHHIIRGTADSVKTAMMFGEYFPNPSFSTAISDISLMRGFFVEAIGTFLLVTIILLLTEDCNVGRPSSDIAPIFIGLTVTVIICILAPLTQAGINPARDFGPRLVAYFAGWREIAIPGPRSGFFTVYIMGPFMGGSLSAVLFGVVLHPLMEVKDNIGACEARCPTLLSKGLRFIRELKSH